MATLDEVTAEMRRLGVRRLAFVNDGRNIYCPTVSGVYVGEVELSDTIPAPPSFDASELETEPDKPPGTCIALGCMEPGGWHFDRRYCGPHGRSAAGIKP